jgi:hypothetical protein
MTNDKQKMADRIRALLAKAASTTSEAEAEAFMAKAHELMEKHQLDASDLEHDDPVGYERTYRRNSAATPDWDFMLIFPVARYYGCKAIRIDLWKGYEMEIVGRDSARVTTTEMHKYLVKTVRRLGREKAATDPMPLYHRDADPEYDEPIGYMNADQTSRAIGNALRERINNLAYQQERKNKAVPTATGKNALVTLDVVTALYKKLHPGASSIRGSMSTTNDARLIAEGIGLNLQTGGRDTLRLK